MPLYTYEGLGHRVITTGDFETLGVNHKGFYVDQGDTIELTEDAAKALLDRREAFSLVPGTEDAPEGDEGENVEAEPASVPTVDDPEANVDTSAAPVDKPAGEEPGTSIDPASPDVAKPSTKGKKSGTGQVVDG